MSPADVACQSLKADLYSFVSHDRYIDASYRLICELVTRYSSDFSLFLKIPIRLVDLRLSSFPTSD